MLLEINPLSARFLKLGTKGFHSRELPTQQISYNTDGGLAKQKMPEINHRFALRLILRLGKKRTARRFCRASPTYFTTTSTRDSSNSRGCWNALAPQYIPPNMYSNRANRIFYSPALYESHTLVTNVCTHGHAMKPHLWLWQIVRVQRRIHEQMTPDNPLRTGARVGKVTSVQSRSVEAG